MTLQVGQTTQPRIPASRHFPTTIVCRVNPFDGSKLNQTGFSDTLFEVAQNSSNEEFSDLNLTWNNVTMGINNTVIIQTSTRNWDPSISKQRTEIIFV